MLVLSHLRSSLSISSPSSLMLPASGLYQRSRSPIIVLFPDPLAPYNQWLGQAVRTGKLITYYKCSHFSGRDIETEVFQHSDVWASGIAERDVFEVDDA